MRPILFLAVCLLFGSCSILFGDNLEPEPTFIQTIDNPEESGGSWRYGVMGNISEDTSSTIRLRSYRRPVAGTNYSEGIGEISGTTSTRRIAYLEGNFDLLALSEGTRLRAEVDYSVPDRLGDADIRLALAFTTSPILEEVTRSGMTDISVDGQSVVRAFNRLDQLTNATLQESFQTVESSTTLEQDTERVNVLLIAEFPAGSSGGFLIRQIRLLGFED